MKWLENRFLRDLGDICKGYKSSEISKSQRIRQFVFCVIDYTMQQFCSVQDLRRHTFLFIKPKQIFKNKIVSFEFYTENFEFEIKYFVLKNFQNMTIQLNYYLPFPEIVSHIPRDVIHKDPVYKIPKPVQHLRKPNSKLPCANQQPKVQYWHDLQSSIYAE